MFDPSCYVNSMKAKLPLVTSLAYLSHTTATFFKFRNIFAWFIVLIVHKVHCHLNYASQPCGEGDIWPRKLRVERGKIPEEADKACRRHAEWIAWSPLSAHSVASVSQVDLTSQDSRASRVHSLFFSIYNKQQCFTIVRYLCWCCISNKRLAAVVKWVSDGHTHHRWFAPKHILIVIPLFKIVNYAKVQHVVMITSRCCFRMSIKSISHDLGFSKSQNVFWTC